jgi:hypothetical protein
MQATLDLGYFPTVLKETVTIVLRKPEKPDYTVPKAYRPIALENTIGKIFESVMAEIISYLTEAHELLPAEHFGGRPGRSTEDALVIIKRGGTGKYSQLYSWTWQAHSTTYTTRD